MSSKENHSEFIAEIRFTSGKDLSEKLSQIRRQESFRAVVLILDFETNKVFDEKLFEHIKFFPIPIICAAKISVSKNEMPLIENSHLCIAAKHLKFDQTTSEEALEKGLINKIAALKDVEKEAFELAEEISKLAPLAIRACLKAVNEGFEMNLEDGLKLESELFTQIFKTEDMREGTRAFLKKRRPVFRGK